MAELWLHGFRVVGASAGPARRAEARARRSIARSDELAASVLADVR